MTFATTFIRSFWKRATRLRHDARGYLLFAAAVFIPILITGAALAIDTAQYFSARKLMQGAADEAAHAAFDAFKAKRDPVQAARDTFERATGELGTLGAVDYDMKTMASGRELTLTLATQIRLPMTTEISGYGMAHKFVAVSREGKGRTPPPAVASGGAHVNTQQQAGEEDVPLR